MANTEADSLAAIKAAMKDPNVAIKFTQTFSHGLAVQVYIKTRKIGPFILPAEDQSIADILYMLGEMAVGEDTRAQV